MANVVHPTERDIIAFLRGDHDQLIIPVNEQTKPGLEAFIEHLHSNAVHQGELQFRELLKSKADY